MSDFKTLTELGLALCLTGTLFLSLPAFKSKLKYLVPDFDEDKVSVTSTRTGLIFVSVGFSLQFIAIMYLLS